MSFFAQLTSSTSRSTITSSILHPGITASSKLFPNPTTLVPVVSTTSASRLGQLKIHLQKPQQQRPSVATLWNRPYHSSASGRFVAGFQSTTTPQTWVGARILSRAFRLQQPPRRAISTSPPMSAGIPAAPPGHDATRKPHRFAPLDPNAKHGQGLPKLKGIIFDVDGTLW